MTSSTNGWHLRYRCSPGCGAWCFVERGDLYLSAVVGWHRYAAFRCWRCRREHLLPRAVCVLPAPIPPESEAD
jgi:hypothetical protein